MKNFANAVCCECQRFVVNGAFLDNPANQEYVMKRHPANSVFVDVSKDGWEAEFDPAVHTSCLGGGSTPQLVEGMVPLFERGTVLWLEKE
jgi:hypothetical protein